MVLFGKKRVPYEDARAAVIAKYSTETLREGDQINRTVRNIQEVGAIAARGDRAAAEEVARTAFSGTPLGSPAARSILEELLAGDVQTVLAEMFEALHDGYFDTALRAFANKYRLGNDLSRTFDDPFQVRRLEGLCFAGCLSKYMPDGVMERCLDDMRQRSLEDHYLRGFVEGASSGA